MTPQARSFSVALLAVSMLAFAWLAASFWFVIDDAYISYRFSQNWALGHGLRYNLGDHTPVEGYSNFLWVAIAALVEWVRLPAASVMPALSFASAFVLPVYLYRSTQDRFDFGPETALLTAVATMASPAIVVWATGGLATMPFAVLMYVLFDQWVLGGRRDEVRRGVWIAIALMLIRAEGIGWVVVMGTMAAILRGVEPGEDRVGVAAMGRAVAIVVALFGVYSAWRWMHFGTLVANTALVKVAFGEESLVRGSTYLVKMWLVLIAPVVQLLGLLAMWPVARWRGLMVGAMAVGVPTYAVVVGGDFMTMGRLLVPGIAFGAVLLGFCAHYAARLGRNAMLGTMVVALGVTAVGALPLWETHVMPLEVRKQWRVRFNTPAFRSEVGQWRFMRTNAKHWANVGRALKATSKPGESVVLGAIGAIGYHSGLFVYDRFGLVTREVAMREGSSRRRSPGHDKAVPAVWFLDQEPTYLWVETVRGSPGLRRMPREVQGWRNKPLNNAYGPHLGKVRMDGETFHVVSIKRQKAAGRSWNRFLDGLSEAVGSELQYPSGPQQRMPPAMAPVEKGEAEVLPTIRKKKRRKRKRNKKVQEE